MRMLVPDLVELRQSLGLTQREAALLLEVTVNTWARWERGELGVSTGLEAADWSTRREIIRTLVSRVEIDHQQVHVVFRVQLNAFVSSPSHDVLQHCGRSGFTTPGQYRALSAR
ncbi:MAG: DUF1870 family protein [Chloroflexota bacterium]|nr:DUF1870 family protein [Chloroflexota bacterium]